MKRQIEVVAPAAGAAAGIGGRIASDEADAEAEVSLREGCVSSPAAGVGDLICSDDVEASAEAEGWFEWSSEESWRGRVSNSEGLVKGGKRSIDVEGAPSKSDGASSTVG